MRKKRTALLLLLPFAVITALVLFSAVVVLVQSLGFIPAFGLHEFTLHYYLDALGDERFLQALGVSLYVAFVSAVAATAGGILVSAALVARRQAKGGALHIVRLPILVPHIVVALFVSAVFSQTGLAARLAYALGLIQEYTQFPQLLYTGNYLGTILAYLWKEIPFVAYFVLALMSSVRETLGEAAENLGASPLRSFFQVTLPLTFPAICNAFLIIFIFAFGGYELPLLLGPTLPKALPVFAYLEFSSPDLQHRPYAMAANGCMLILSCAMAALYAGCTHRLMKRLEGSAL